MKNILFARLVATLTAAGVVAACAALEEQAPALDTAATDAMQAGACVKLVCALDGVFLSHCRPRAARCHR